MQLDAVKDDRKLKMKYVREKMDRMEEDRRRERRFDKADTKRGALLKIEYDRLHRSGDFRELKKRWESTCKMTEEMKRLKVVEEEKNSRRPWDGRSQAMDPSHAKKLDLGTVTSKREYSGPSPMAVAAKERAQARMQEKANRGKVRSRAFVRI